MAQKTFRVISAAQAKASGPHAHRMVNIITDNITSDKHHSVKTVTQASGAAPVHEYETVVAGATGTNASPPLSNGLQTILIAGYNGPA